MFRKKRYRYNHDTLAYELHRTPLKVLFSRGFMLFLCTLGTAIGYFWIYTNYFKLDTPKMLELKRENADLLAKLDVMNHQMEMTDLRLERLKQRDNNVYRPIFGMGMDGVSDEERNAGFGGADRYSHLEYSRNSLFLTGIAMRVDQLTKKTVVQSRSFDEVGKIAEQTDKMTSSIPAILPVDLAKSGSKTFRISSGYGMRKDPVYGDIRPHQGIDISGPIGAEIHATGDGVVATRGFELSGYGNYVIIDHGFGYKTRYAHMLYNIPVREGQTVSRGEVIGYMGSTGKSIGPHVHYEVMLQNVRVNPNKYYSEDIASDEYVALIGAAKGK